jgi:beta propeller repeat protein
MNTIPEAIRMTGRGSGRNLRRNVTPGAPSRVYFLLIICLLLISLCSASPYGTETIITTDSVASAQTSPAMYGDRIVWADARDITIHLYNLTTGEETVLPSHLFEPKSPSLYGDTIVWQDMDSFSQYKIIIYNTTTATTDSIDVYNDWIESTNPKIYRDEVVWQDFGSGTEWNIFLYNITTGIPTAITDIANGISEKSPAIFDNFIVYENWSDSFGNPDIWLYNVSNSTAVQISTIDGPERFPDISGSRIVWAGPDRIYLYNDGTINPISPPSDPNMVGNPSIYGDRVVYNDYRGTSGTYVEIYMYDIPLAREYRLVPRTGAFDLKLPKIYGTRIVWEDGRSGASCMGCDSDIYLLTLGPVETCPVADFTPKNNVGANPFNVQFADVSSSGTSGISHRFWNFSDGSVFDTIPNPLHHFTTGVCPVKLTVGNTKCRNTTPDICAYRVYSGSPPLPDFTTTPTAGFAPLTVTFTDQSCGKPTDWQWDFNNDGSFDSTEQNPTHVYTQSGTSFDVSLTTDNGYGPNTTVYNNLVRTFLGNTGTSDTNIDGITVDHRFGAGLTSLTVDTTKVPHFNLAVPTLALYPPAAYGWQNLTVTASDALGFSLSGSSIGGNVSTSALWTSDVTVPDNSPTLGSGWGANYRLNQMAFPIPAFMRTEIWESTIPTDEADARSVATSINRILRGTAYTVNITKINLTANGNAVINMSIDSNAPWLGADTSDVMIIGLGWLPTGDRVGAILQTDHTTVGGAEYFSGAAPNSLTKFILAKVSGSGNPFQLITLSVSTRAAPVYSNPSTETSDNPGAPSSIAQGAAAQSILPQAFPPPALPEAKTADLYINYLGVVTQTTVLESADKLATVAIGQGVTALDASGKPLSSVSITTLASSEIPAVPQGTALDFVGIAFELQPDGATFSPSITVTFTVQNARWGQHYAIREFDHTTQSWIDLPTTYNPASGTISASVTRFCCIALFSETINAPQNPRPTTIATLIPAEVNSPPVGAIGIFTGLMLWSADVFTKNIYLVALVLAVMLFVYLKGRKKRLDRVRYKL